MPLTLALTYDDLDRLCELVDFLKILLKGLNILVTFGDF